MKEKTKKKSISWLCRCKQKIKEEHPIIMTYYRFYKKMGYFCHLRHPRTFNEKIQYLKIFYYPKNPLITQCADKYAVRKFISEKGYENLLVPLIGCWDSVEAVDFDSLPDRFVIKCNHGSGYNILCHDKRSFDKINQGGVLREWMEKDFSDLCGELHYKNIPRKIIAEEYLGEEIYDYKFFCMNGKPVFFYISQEIPGTDKVRCSFWDIDGKPAEFERTDEEFYERDNYPTLPQHLKEMKQIAADLSKEFLFVRVDLFEVNGKVYFSELTFTPAAGMMPFKPKEWDRRLGDMLELHEK